MEGSRNGEPVSDTVSGMLTDEIRVIDAAIVPPYSNPLLDEDWPDPDAIRVGEDYYLVASSFNRSPGLPVLHSRDLVNWTLLTHALDRVGPDSYNELPRHGGGVWAPSIRHHDGQFHIVFPDPDRGIFVTSASDPAGPWSPPRLLLQGLGLIDPCPLWAADGRTWLVHGWARSRAGVKNLLTVIPVDAALTQATGPGTVVADGADLGWETLEGPKFYERDGWYWIFAPAGGVATGFQGVLRSRDPLGPYEAQIALNQGESPVNGPHQGAWVEASDGSEWFLHFQDRGVFGRVLHLQPLTWREGWPVIGTPVDGETWGEPVSTYPAERDDVPPTRVRSLTTSDDFTAGINPMWRWQADPGDWAEVSNGELNLTGPALDGGNLRTLPSVLGQVLPGTGVRLETAVRLEGPAGSRAGIGVLGYGYGWVGLVSTEQGCDVVAAVRAEGDGAETREVLAQVAAGERVEIALEVTPEAGVELRLRTGASTWRNARLIFTAREGQWIGAELVLFSAAPLGGVESLATFGAVEIEVGR